MTAPRRIPPRVALLTAVLTLGGYAAAHAAAPSAEEIAALKARLAAQQDVLEAQMRQLREQQARLDELERRLTDAPAAAPEPAVAAAAAAEPAALPPPVVTGRYDGVGVVIGGSLRTTVNTTGARMLPDAAPFLVLPSVPGGARRHDQDRRTPLDTADRHPRP
jgi:uncharacterized coiled-coil protein SlyX